MTRDDIPPAIAEMIDGFARPQRSPILRTPAEEGLAYEDLCFPSEDGTPLEAWFIPAAGSDRLIVCNHPLTFNRYGFPSHLPPWNTGFGDFGGNDFEVNFIPDYRILHEAGYNVLTYDFRNFGHSPDANGRVQSNGIFESRDVIGAQRYVRSRPDLAAMRLGLFSRCLGANSTMMAMARAPDEFAEVRCMLAALPLSVRYIVESLLAHMGLSDKFAEFDFAQKLVTGIDVDRMSPLAAAASVQVPTYLYSVRDDVLTRPEDVQSIHDAIPAEKALEWVEGTTARWNGYCHFQRAPTAKLAWLDRFMRG